MALPFQKQKYKAAPHNAARTAGEKIRVMMTALFCRNTLCISRKSDYIRAQIFRRMPQSHCAALPQINKFFPDFHEILSQYHEFVKIAQKSLNLGHGSNIMMLQFAL